jgi:hypothetical protein
MVWDKRVRLISWVFFILMWVPFGIMTYTAVTDGDEVKTVLGMVLFFCLCTLFAILLVGSFVIGRREKEKIKRKGIPAKATILSVSETGTRINDQPLLRIELEVHPPYASRFVTTVEYIVPYDALPQVQPGNTVPVYYLDGTTMVALADL